MQRSDTDPPLVGDILERGALKAREAVEADAELGEGSEIGSYVITGEPLGQGGSSTVYLAEQRRPIARKVAIKLPEWDGLDGRGLAEAHSERALLGSLDHPYVARILDAGFLPSGRPYLVMDHVEGAPIDAYCDGRKLPPRRRVELLIGLCEAIQHAHQRGVIHRDLKPGNVLVSSGDSATPTPRVIDFGLALAEGREALGNRGTLGYMSPEQREGKVADVRSDIFSIGCIGWRLLTGEPPAGTGGSPLGQLRRDDERAREHAERCGVSPRSLLSDLGGGLSAVLAKATCPDEEGRHQSVESLHSDLRACLDNLPVSPLSHSRAHVFRCFLRRHRISSSLAAAAACTFLVAGVVAIWQAARATLAERHLAQALVAEEGRRLEAETLTRFSSRLLAGDPDGAFDRRSTIVDMLDAATVELGDFGGSPVSRAHLTATLRDAYSNRGYMSKAASLAGEAVGLCTEIHGTHAPDTLDALEAHCDILLRSFAYQEARIMLKLARGRTLPGTDRHRHLGVLVAESQLAGGRPDRAIGLINQQVRGLDPNFEERFVLSCARFAASDEGGPQAGLVALVAETAASLPAGSLHARATFALADQFHTVGDDEEPVSLLSTFVETPGLRVADRDGAALRLAVLRGELAEIGRLRSEFALRYHEAHPLTVASGIAACRHLPAEVASPRLGELAEVAIDNLGPHHALGVEAIVARVAVESGLPTAQLGRGAGNLTDAARQILRFLRDHHAESMTKMSASVAVTRLRLALLTTCDHLPLDSSPTSAGSAHLLWTTYKLVEDELRGLAEGGRAAEAVALLSEYLSAISRSEKVGSPLTRRLLALRLAVDAKGGNPVRVRLTVPIVPGLGPI